MVGSGKGRKKKQILNDNKELFKYFLLSPIVKWVLRYKLFGCTVVSNTAALQTPCCIQLRPNNTDNVYRGKTTAP